MKQHHKGTGESEKDTQQPGPMNLIPPQTNDEGKQRGGKDEGSELPLAKCIPVGTEREFVAIIFI